MYKVSITFTVPDKEKAAKSVADHCRRCMCPLNFYACPIGKQPYVDCDRVTTADWMKHFNTGE